MDAASYAVERNRNLQDNVQKIIQMFLMSKQNKQEQDWRQGQFDYQKGQDVINQEQQNRTLERQDKEYAQSQRYQRAMSDMSRRRLELAENKPAPKVQTLEEKMAEWEAQADINEKHRRPEQPRATPQPSSLSERYEMFKKIAGEMKLTTDQANSEWSNYLLGKNNRQPSAFDNLLNSDSSFGAKEPALGSTGKAKDGTTVYYKGNGKWSNVR